MRHSWEESTEVSSKSYAIKLVKQVNFRPIGVCHGGRYVVRASDEFTEAAEIDNINLDSDKVDSSLFQNPH